MQQQTKAGLTKRERTLILSAAAVGLFYLAFQFGFMPLNNAYIEKSAQLGDLESEQSQVKSDLELADRVRLMSAETAERYKEVVGLYLPTGSDTDLSRKLMDICRRNGMDVTGPQSWGTPIAFFPPKPAVEGETEARVPAFSVSSVPFTISGTYDEIKRLIDAVNEDRDLRISSLTFSPQGDGVSVMFMVTLINELG
jgi:hypothetical protein